MRSYSVDSAPASLYWEEIEQIKQFLTPANRSFPVFSNGIDTGIIQSKDLPYSRFAIMKNNSLSFSELSFRSVEFPVLWLDTFGEVHWNKAAERSMKEYLLEKQFPLLRTSLTSRDVPKDWMVDCSRRQLLLLDQWKHGGFLSRLNCLVEQFGQSLYSASMVLITPRQFTVNGAAEDYLHEGILGYIYPISRCSAYLHHPSMSSIKRQIEMIMLNKTQEPYYIQITTFKHLRQHSDVKFLYLPDIWKFSYEHIPYRRWLFDFDRERAIKTIFYNSSDELLMQHDREHIYRSPNINFNLHLWNPKNSPFVPSTDNLDSNYLISWKDKVFTSFIRYMITLYVYQLAPRIQILTRLLMLHWTKYLGDKNQQPYNTTLNNMAAIFIRRGDKMPEDSFWRKHQYWRNISYYVKGLVDEEKHRKKNFSSVFIMTDDASVMNEILEYANKNSNFSGEDYARRHLYGRQIIYNVFAPQPCFDPFIRVGFDQFLVSFNFVVEYSSFTVSHTDSNVGSYLERIIYAKRHMNEQKAYRTSDFVRNAPDALD